MVNDDSGNAVNNLDPKSMRNEIEESLKRLRTDYIGLYQIHKPDPKVHVENYWGTLVELKREGKARFIGVSTYDVSLLEKCMKIEQVQSLQPPYSMLSAIMKNQFFHTA